jgi:hypothetical protein
MPDSTHTRRAPQRRTVEEAIAQADAKDRIRTASSVRSTGVAVAVLGASLLSRPRAARSLSQAINAVIHHGPSVALATSAVFGLIAIIAGPVTIVAGIWLLRRANAAARANPVTAVIFDPLARHPLDNQ